MKKVGLIILTAILIAVSCHAARPHLTASPTCEDTGGHLEVYGDLAGHRWVECDR